MAGAMPTASGASSTGASYLVSEEERQKQKKEILNK